MALTEEGPYRIDGTAFGKPMCIFLTVDEKSCDLRIFAITAYGSKHRLMAVAETCGLAPFQAEIIVRKADGWEVCLHTSIHGSITKNAETIALFLEQIGNETEVSFRAVVKTKFGCEYSLTMEPDGIQN